MMTRSQRFVPRGVIPAVILPFDAELAIDARAYRRHLRDVAAVAGITAVTTNAHASEVASCSAAEQERVLALTVEELGDRLPVVAGIYADGSLEAARLARMAAAGGAAALLVFPPQPFVMGGQLRPAMALAHLARIAEATDLPLIVFQYPLAGGQGYPLDTLVAMAETVPAMVAIKDMCQDPVLHARQVRALHGLTRPVAVLTTHSAWLLASLTTGCAGILSGSGSIIADLHVALWRAVEAGDLGRARAAWDRIRPTAERFYAPPLVDMHNRMKEALVLLGRIPCAAVRPPLVRLEADEIERIGRAIEAAGLEREGARALAA